MVLQIQSLYEVLIISPLQKKKNSRACVHIIIFSEEQEMHHNLVDIAMYLSSTCILKDIATYLSSKCTLAVAKCILKDIAMYLYTLAVAKCILKDIVTYLNSKCILAVAKCILKDIAMYVP